MKILFCGYHNPNFETMSEYIEKAIVSLGHTLVVYDDRQFLLPGRLRDRIRFLHDLDLRRLNDRLVALVRKTKPDICIFSGGNRILTGHVAKIRNLGTTAVLWTADAPHDPSPIFESAPYYDFIFTSGTEMLELLKGRGIGNLHWLPFACDPEYHHPIDIIAEEYKKYGSDIAFVGSFYPNRMKIFEKIADLDIGIWGPGWQNVPAGSPLKKRIKRAGNIKPEEWVRILSAANIIITAHYQDDKVPCYQASPKVYETLACRRFFLVDDQKDVRALFEDGKHLVVFKDTADLRAKIKYYLANSDKSSEIAENGYNEVMRKHTYVHRVKKMMSIISPAAAGATE